MEMDAELASMAQEEDAKVPPFTPTHHLRDGFLSFTEFLLRNVDEWSKPHTPWPPPPPPIAFSGSDRFIKGRLPHRTFAISASLSSLFDDAAKPLLNVYNHGDVHADCNYTLVSMQDMTCDDTLSIMCDAKHGDDHRASTASTHCNMSIHVGTLDSALKSDTNCVRSQAEDAVQGLSSNGMVACSTDNTLEVNADCMRPQDSSSVSANETTDVATCNTDKLLVADPQREQGTVQLSHEDDRRVQPSHEAGLPSTQPDGLDCSKKLDGHVYVPDNASLVDKNCLRMQYEEGCLPLSEDSMETLVEGGNVAAETLVDVVAELSLLLECKSSLAASIRTGDEDGVAESSPTKSHTDGLAEISLPSKSHNDNNLTGDTSGSPELSLPATSKSHNENNLTGDAYGVADLSLPSSTKSHSVNNVTCDVDGLAQLSLPSPRKSGNADNLTCDANGVAELSSPAPTKSHNVNMLQNMVMEAPVILRQDEHDDDDLEEGELSETLPDDECLDTMEGDKTVGEAQMLERRPLDANRIEPKALESTTDDDEMNQPISLFISRYRSRSVNPSPLDTKRDLKKERKTGNKRKIEEHEQLLKEIVGADMAGEGKSRQAKGVQKGSSKVAKTCSRGLTDHNGGGPVGLARKVSIGAKVDTSEAKESVQKKYGELGATHTATDQVMASPGLVSSEREDGALRTHGEGSTENGLAGSEHFVTLKKHKVCLPMVVEEDLSTIDAGNDQTFSQAEGASKKKKPKRGGSETRRKKRQQKKHRKWDERQGLGVHKLRLKPCVDKQKEKKPCHFYVRGKCGKGASCTFSHNVTQATKSEMCKYFVNNCCLRGDECPYSHALKTFPCKYFHTRGKCMDADSCRFSHQPISEEAKQKLLAKFEEDQEVREGSKVTVCGRVNSKHAVSQSELELFPLGGKHANKKSLMGKDAAASKISSVDTTVTNYIRNSASKIAMAFEAKKAAFTFTGGCTSTRATSTHTTSTLTFDPTGPLADKSGEKSTTPNMQSSRRESGGLLAVSSNPPTTQERKTKVDAFLQSQLDNSHLMRKSNLGTGSESSKGCYTLLNQPRALSMGQTSLVKVPNTSASSELNAGAKGLLQASKDCSQLIPNSKLTMSVDTACNSNLSVHQQKSLSNGGSDALVSKPPLLGPSLLDIVSMSQGATAPKGPASASGLLSAIINAAAPKRSTANVILDRFLKG